MVPPAIARQAHRAPQHVRREMHVGIGKEQPLAGSPLGAEHQRVRLAQPSRQAARSPRSPSGDYSLPQIRAEWRPSHPASGRSRRSLHSADSLEPAASPAPTESFSASSRAAKITEIEGASASGAGGESPSRGTRAMPNVARVVCTIQAAAMAPKSAVQKECKGLVPRAKKCCTNHAITREHVEAGPAAACTRRASACYTLRRKESLEFIAHTCREHGL